METERGYLELKGTQNQSKEETYRVIRKLKERKAESLVYTVTMILWKPRVMRHPQLWKKNR